MKELIKKHGIEAFGRFYGVYHGTVKDLEEGTGVGRVQVYIPEVRGIDGTAIWAIPRGQYAGKNYGTQLLPEQGAQVVITFRHGHPLYPMWEHSNFGVNEKPEEFKDNAVKGLITPLGTKILIQLDGESEKIFITTPAGVTFEINDTSLKLGKGDETEYLAKGDTTKALLEDLVTVLKPLFVTAGAPITTSLDTWAAKLETLLAKYS